MYNFFGHSGKLPKKATIRGGPLPMPKPLVSIVRKEINPRPRVQSQPHTINEAPYNSSNDICAPDEIPSARCNEIDEEEIFTGYISDFDDEDSDYSSDSGSLK